MSPEVKNEGAYKKLTLGVRVPDTNRYFAPLEPEVDVAQGSGAADAGAADAGAADAGAADAAGI